MYPPPAKLRALSLILPLLLLSPAAFGAENEFTSKTYLKFHEDARDSSYAPLYEYVELESRDREKGLSFSLAGWAGHDFETAQFENKTRNELTSAMVRYSPYTDRRLLLTAGRQFIFEGVASERVDGVAVHWEPAPASGLSLFGGAPSEVEAGSANDDAVYGGRVYQRIRNRAELGLSVLSASGDGRRSREEGGVDLWLRPMASVEVKGQSSYNNITDGWREHSYNLRIFPTERLTLSGQYAELRYDDAFSTTTLSVFSPDTLGAGEQLVKQGGAVDYRVNDNLKAAADYVHYDYRTMGGADYYGGGVWATVLGIPAGLSGHRMDGPAEELRYLEARVYAYSDREAWRLSFDAINLRYDEPVNGLTNAYSLNGTVRYRISDSLSTGFNVDYSRTPDFLRQTTALLNLVYGYKDGR
jgi:hypothetical protein